MTRRLLVTGGAGFIGSAFVHHVLAHTDDSVTVLDSFQRLRGLFQDLQARIYAIEGGGGPGGAFRALIGVIWGRYWGI